MSSTNKTKNLKLSQWELSDPFRMEDMNRDFKKIDEEVASKVFVRLLDMTIEESIKTVELSLTDIDFKNIFEVYVYFPSGSNASMRVNSFSGTLQNFNYSGNWQTAGSTVSSPDGRITIRNSCGLGGTRGDVYLEGLSTYKASASSMGALRRLTLTASSTFSAGDRFVVLGVKA